MTRLREETTALCAADAEAGSAVGAPATVEVTARPRPWRKWLVAAASVIAASGALYSAQQRMYRIPQTLEAKAPSPQVPFGAVDLNGDNSIDAHEISELLRRHNTRLVKEVEGDESLDDAIKKTKTALLQQQLENQVKCWTQSLQKYEAKAGAITKTTFPLFLEVASTECASMRASLLDASPFAMDSRTSETQASGQFSRATPRDSDPILSFLEADANHDGVLDVSEVGSVLVAPMQSLLQRLRADDSLSESLKATRSQLLQDDIDRKLDCVRRAVDKLSQDDVPLTLETFPAFESVLCDLCGKDHAPHAISMEQRHHSAHAHAPQHHETTTTHAIRTQRPLPSLPSSPLGDGADITERPSPADPEEGPNRLRSMLLTAFGLDENGNVLDESGVVLDDGTLAAATDAPEATTAPPAVDPSEDPLGALADQLFRTLLDPANAPSNWNWLDPASDSFARVTGDSQQRTATVRAVYHHLLSERERKATALIAEILRNEVTYNLTMTCFNTGVERLAKFEVDEDEYNALVAWMNDECHADSDAQAAEHARPQAPQQLPPHEFQERLTAHLGPVVRAYESGALHLPTPPAANAAMRTKMDKCVAEATHQAVDKASGLASTARFNEALVWIFDQCLAPL